MWYIKLGAISTQRKLTGATNMKSAFWRSRGFVFALSSVLAFVMVIVVLAGPEAAAQTSNGTIVGTVLDKTGAVVPKAKVTAISKDLGIDRTTETDAAGAYRVEN